MKRLLIAGALLVSPVWAEAKPAFCMPATIPAAEGVPCNIYYARMLDSVQPAAYVYEAISEAGTSWQDRWSWTPTAKDAGRRVEVVFNAWTDDGLVASATTTVTVAKSVPDAVKARKTTFALLSDSDVNCLFQDQIRNRMRAAGFTGYTPVGSHTGGSASPECDPAKGAPHDGYGGYTWRAFLSQYAVTVDEIDNLQAEAERQQLKSFGVRLAPGNEWRKALLKSPILRIRDGRKVVDVQAWFDKVNGGAAPDYIAISLGGNGIACIPSGGSVEKAVAAEIAAAKEVLAHLRKAAPDATIVICSNGGGSIGQTGWGKNYGAKYPAFRGHRNRIAYDRAAMKLVAESGDPKLKFMPVGQNLDPIGAYPSGERDGNALHPTREGGKQIGDAFFAWLLNDLTAGPVAPKQAKKVLMIGNSFSISNVRHMPPVCRDLGLGLELGSLYIGGCSLERHWNNLVAATNAAFRPYSYQLFRDGEKVADAPESANIPEIVKGTKWDVITLQQASHFSWRPETYNPYFKDLYKQLKQLCPGAEIVLQETWSYTPFDKRLAEWKMDQHQMYAKLHRAYCDSAASSGLRVIPMGTAVQLWRERLPVRYAADTFGGDVCGSMRDGKFADRFHLNARGQFLQSLVWTAKLFGADVTKGAYRPSDMSADEAAKMKAVAMSAVRGELPSPAFGGGTIPADVAAGLARIRATSVESGEIVELDYRPNRLRVGFVLRPGKESYIRCELALPDPAKWDGRLWGSGNGGWAGGVGCPGVTTSAAVSTDLGTSRTLITQNPVARDVVEDFGWRATHLMTVQAKAFIRAYYGKAPSHCYFIGSSTGGGQGYCEATRFPEDYDGIVAGVPAMNRTSRIALVWRLEQLRKTCPKWFSKAEKKLILDCELDYFRPTDPEVARGRFIWNPLPTEEKLDGIWKLVLAREPKLADRERVWRALFEPVVVKGRTLDPGETIGREFEPPGNFCLGKIIGPYENGDLTEDQLLAFADCRALQFDRPEEFAPFFRRGGKFLSYVGFCDPQIPPRTNLTHYEKLAELSGGMAALQKSFRMFAIPGRSHGTEFEKVLKHSEGYFAGDPEGCRQLMQDWVEKGVAPDSVTVPLLRIADDGRKLTLKPYGGER